jgi:SAM-dependent MidA family methyltransferase
LAGGAQKFGEKGDFITAPETSDLFGFCLARQCAQVLESGDSILDICSKFTKVILYENSTHHRWRTTHWCTNHQNTTRTWLQYIIQKAEPIGFDEFMNLALYCPAKGYYSGGAQKFGEKGDFITAPETSDLFGSPVKPQQAQTFYHCYKVVSTLARPIYHLDSPPLIL